MIPQVHEELVIDAHRVEVVQGGRRQGSRGDEDGQAELQPHLDAGSVLLFRLWRREFGHEHAVRTFDRRIGFGQHADPDDLFLAGLQREQRRHGDDVLGRRVNFPPLVGL